MNNDQKANVVFPAQCDCGHIFLEKYKFEELNDNGEIGFCWCGFCRTKVMVKPNGKTTNYSEADRRIPCMTNKKPNT